MVNFQIDEDATVGSIVYTLKGIDPEGVKVTYTISGDHFSVTRETGVITLRAPLDREVEELIEVVVTVQVFFFQKFKKLFLFPKLYLPSVRKNCSSEREKLLKFETDGQEFAKILRSSEQFI